MRKSRRRAPMDRTPRLAKLTATVYRLKIELNSLVELERNEVARPKLRKLVGRCFKCLNSYGSGDKWWFYTKVVAFSESDLTFQTVEFQHCSDKRMEIRYERLFNFSETSRFGVDSGWMPISAADYNRERRKCLSFVQKLLMK